MFEIAKKYAPKDYYSWISSFYRIFGLLPPKQTKKRIVYFFLTLPNIFLCVYLLNFLEFYIMVRDFFKDFSRTLISICAVVTGATVMIRITNWMLFQDQFLPIKSIIERDTFEFRCFSIRSIKYNDVFEVAKRKAHILKYEDLKKLSRNIELVVDKERNPVEKYSEETMVLTRLFCCVLYLSINYFTVFVYTGAYIFAEYHETFIEASNSTYAIWDYCNMVCFKFDSPFFERHGWILDYYQLYSYIMRMFIFIPVLTNVTNTVVHLSTQIKVVGKGFSCVDENIDPHLTPEMVMLIKEIRIVKCITELQEIYRAIYLMEEFINMQMLCQYGIMSIMLCITTYTIAGVNNVQEVICVIMFLVACLIEALTFTYNSHTLSQELENLMKPVYALDWTGYPKRLKQNVLILITRLQRREVLTAGKIINLDLLFFVQLLQRAYSLYTIIRNTRDAE